MFLEPEHTWRHVHGFTRKSEQQSQDFRAIAFIFFTRANRRITPHTTLPYRIGDFSLSWLSLGERKVGKEEQVDEPENGLGMNCRRQMAVTALAAITDGSTSILMQLGLFTVLVALQANHKLATCTVRA